MLAAEVSYCMGRGWGWPGNCLPSRVVGQERAADLTQEIMFRAETAIPNWLSKLLNGRDEFETRVVALVQGGQQP